MGLAGPSHEGVAYAAAADGVSRWAAKASIQVTAASERRQAARLAIASAKVRREGQQAGEVCRQDQRARCRVRPVVMLAGPVIDRVAARPTRAPLQAGE